MTLDPIIQDQIQAKNLVRELLQTDQRYRNDDLWLILQIWQQKQQIKLFIPYDKLCEMIKPETITRVRREIQNTQGEFLPTDPSVLVRRKVKEDIIRSYYQGNDRLLQEWQNIKYGV